LADNEWATGWFSWYLRAEAQLRAGLDACGPATRGSGWNLLRSWETHIVPEGRFFFKSPVRRIGEESHDLLVNADAFRYSARFL
jgi:hypothetical protein